MTIRFRIALFLALTLALSAWVVLSGAADQPYVSFRERDAVIQIGLASALMTLWSMFGLWVILQIRAGRLARSWSASLVLVGAALFFLYQSPSGYVSEIARWGAVR